MVSNGKYDRIAPLLESNTIKQYSDIFDIIAGIKTDVARDLNININRLTQLIASPGNFKMRKVIQQSELFNMPLVQMVQLIEKQHLAKKKKSNPDEKDKRYLQIKTMAKIGEIKTLTDLFKYIVAQDINKGRSTWSNYGSYTFDQVYKLAELCELTFMETFQLIVHP